MANSTNNINQSAIASRAYTDTSTSNPTSPYQRDLLHPKVRTKTRLEELVFDRLLYLQKLLSKLAGPGLTQDSSLSSDSNSIYRQVSVCVCQWIANSIFLLTFNRITLFSISSSRTEQTQKGDDENSLLPFSQLRNRALLVLTRFGMPFDNCIRTSENEKRTALGEADCLHCEIDETSGIRCARHVCLLFVGYITMPPIMICCCCCVEILSFVVLDVDRELTSIRVLACFLARSFRRPCRLTRSSIDTYLP